MAILHLKIARLFPCLSVVFLLSACHSVAPQATLYSALGGEQGIARMTDQFILEIANDERVIHYFEDSNVARFREFFMEHLCMLTDGPCVYTGDTLVDTHVGMNVTESAFNAIVEDLINAMDKVGISIATQNRLLARMAQLREQVIHL